LVGAQSTAYFRNLPYNALYTHFEPRIRAAKSKAELDALRREILAMQIVPLTNENARIFSELGLEASVEEFAAYASAAAWVLPYLSNTARQYKGAIEGNPEMQQQLSTAIGLINVADLLIKGVPFLSALATVLGVGAGTMITVKKRTLEKMLADMKTIGVNISNGESALQKRRFLTELNDIWKGWHPN
jgi:hypothetical protein